MGITEHFNSILNYKIEIDVNKRVNRTKALILLGMLIIVLAFVGYYVGDHWFWAKNKSYSENRIDILKEVLKKQPESNNVRAELAMAQYLNGNNNKAVEILRGITTQEPDNEAAVLYLGLILSEQKEYKESIGLLSNYVKKNQGLQTRIAYLYLGQDYLGVGKYDLSLKTLKTASQSDPGNPVVYYNLGQVYEKLKDKKNAISSYEKALTISSNYVEADKALKSLVSGVPGSPPAPGASETLKKLVSAWYCIGFIILNISFAAFCYYKVRTIRFTPKALVFVAGYSMFMGMLIAKIPVIANLLNLFTVTGLSLIFIGLGIYYIIAQRQLKDEVTCEEQIVKPVSVVIEEVQKPVVEEIEELIKVEENGPIIEEEPLEENGPIIKEEPLEEIQPVKEIETPEKEIKETKSATALDSRDNKYWEDLLNSYVILGFDAKTKGNLYLAARYFASALESNPPPDLETGLVFDICSLLKGIGYEQKAEEFLQYYEMKRASGVELTGLVDRQTILGSIDNITDEEIEETFAGVGETELSEIAVSVEGINGSGGKYDEDLLNSYIILGFDAKAKGKLYLAAKYFVFALEFNLPLDLGTELVFDMCSMLMGAGHYRKAKECLQQFQKRRSSELASSVIKDIKTNIKYLEILQEILLDMDSPNLSFSMVPESVKSNVEEKVKQWTSNPRALR